MSEDIRNIEITIMDINGRIVKIEKTQIFSGLNNIHITNNLSKILTGTYILEISSDNKPIKSLKIFKH